jgi:hypothetical protein
LKENNVYFTHVHSIPQNIKHANVIEEEQNMILKRSSVKELELFESLKQTGRLGARRLACALAAILSSRR